jgi:hypothetical protein
MHLDKKAALCYNKLAGAEKAFLPFEGAAV